MMVWEIEKFIGSNEIYGICPYCDFHYIVGYANRQYSGLDLHSRCPRCDQHLKTDSTTVDVTWDIRTFQEFTKSIQRSTSIKLAIKDCVTEEAWHLHKDIQSTSVPIIPASVYMTDDGIYLVTSEKWVNYIKNMTDTTPKSKEET